MRRAFIYSVCAVGVLLAGSSVAAPHVADVSLGTMQVEWQPTGEFAGMRLRVSGPLGVVEQEFPAGENPLFDLRSMETVADGLYTWEIVAAPNLGEGVRRAMAEARAADAGEAEGRLRASGALPNAGDMVQSGSFRVVGGVIHQPTGEAERGPGLRRVTSDATGGDVRRVTAEDQVIPDDLIVQGSACVGIDCVVNENFGFDTIRMKENNTRIDFTDTSSSAGFPSQDWEIAANDSAGGGRNALIVSDETTQLFVIESGDAANALYVDDLGRVGLRTSNPVLDLHISTTNTPAIRLEQTNAGGFTAQTWDVAGNEANFFVRDVTGGSLLPFRIRPGARTSSIDIAADGDVGMGTTSPQQRLHIQDSTSSDGPKIFFGIDALDATVGHTIGVRSDVQNVDLQAESLRNFTVIIDDDNNDTAVSNFLVSINGDPNSTVFQVREDERIRMNGASASATTHPLVVGTDATDGNGAFLTAAGIWSNGSSRVNKTAIRPLGAADALTALASLEAVRYRGLQEPSEEYVGFIAEDVPDLVAMNDRKGLASMDIVGVLTKVVQEQQKMISSLQERLAALEEERAEE